MKRRIRSGASGAVLLGALAILPLACAGKSTETESTASTGGGAGSAGVPGNAGQAGATLPPPTRTPVNRFPCSAPTDYSIGLDNCGTYARRTGAVSCDNTCADSCTFGCFADSSCPANQGCDCTAYPSSCVPIGCVSDADCASGFNCASYSFDCGNSGYACQLPADECVSSTDCDNGSECAYTAAGRKCAPAPDCLQ